MAVEELLKYVPPEAIYHRVPLPDDQNSLGPWREAIACYVPPDEDGRLWGELAYGRGETGEPVEFPIGAEGDRLRGLLDQNRPALELLEAGVNRGRLQLPVTTDLCSVLDTLDSVGRGLRGLFRVVSVQIKACLANGNHGRAGKLLIQQLHVGEMVCNGEGWLCGYLSGQGFRGSALAHIQDFVKRGDVPRPILREVLAGVHRGLVTPDGMAQSLRVELFCWALPKIDRLLQWRNVEELVDRLVHDVYQNGYISTAPEAEVSYITPSDDRLAWRREQIVSLLRGHPRPFDGVATVRLLGRMVAASIRSLAFLRWPRLFQLSSLWRYARFCAHWRLCWRQPRGMRYWPAQLAPDFSVEWLGPSEEARARLAESKDDLGPKRFASWQPPTDAEVAACRAKLHRIDNPVGWMLAENLMAGDYRWVARDHRAKLEETRRLLLGRLGG